MKTVATFRRSVIRLVSLAALCLPLSGCVSRPALQTERFLISPAPSAARNQPAVDDIVSLRPVVVAPPFAGQSLVYRISETGYEIDPYAEFLVPPERMLDGAVRQWWQRAGVFRDVLELDSVAASTRVAELHVSEFYGDLRPGGGAAAVVTLRFTLLARREAGGGAGAPAAFTREVTRRVGLRERTAAGVVAGLQEALGEALAELAKAL